jgi:hypothetical protein
VTSGRPPPPTDETIRTPEHGNEPTPEHGNPDRGNRSRLDRPWKRARAAPERGKPGRLEAGPRAAERGVSKVGRLADRAAWGIL